MRRSWHRGLHELMSTDLLCCMASGGRAFAEVVHTGVRTTSQ